MDGLKDKLASMREGIVAAEEREEIGKIKTRQHKERRTRAEDEAAGLRRKIQLAQMKLERVEELTDGKLDKLESLNKHIYQNETSRIQLERKEMKEESTLIHLESRQKSRKMFDHEVEQKYREACNKLRMLEDEVAKVDARIRAAKSNERYYESKLNDAGRTAGSLARSEESKQAKCDEYHEKYRRLSLRKEEVQIYAECMERKVNRMEENLALLERDTEQMQKQALQTKRELRDMLDGLNTYP